MNRFVFVSFLLFLFCAPVFAQNYTIQQYLNIRLASAPALSPNGKRLFYLTNATGTSQIWMVNLPTGAPKQITNYDDNVSFVRFSPKGDGVVFGKAKGGDENAQFFWMKPDGTEIKQLTNNPQVRHNFGSWSNDGTHIFYASNKRNKNFFDVYQMSVADESEELLYQQDGSNAFAAVNDNDTKIIVSRASDELSLDNNLYLVNLKTKQETLLTKHSEATLYGNARFVADGIVFANNEGREFYSLMKMELVNATTKDNWSESNRKNRLLDTTSWDVEDIETYPYGNKLAYTLNNDGFSELYLRRYDTGGKPLITNFNTQSEKIALPAQGVVSGLTFSGDGSKLAFTFSSAKHIPDVWVYDLQTKKLAQITKSSLGEISQDTFVEPQLIKYKSFDGLQIPAWFYRPVKTITLRNGKKQMQPLVNNVPVIVSVHGGPESQERPGFSALYQFYLSRGYAILATNVRGSTGYGKTFSHLDDVRKREDSVKDLAYGVELLKTLNSFQMRNAAVMGGSYGGYMTLAAITLYPDLFAAAVDTVGIVNWESFLKNTSGYRRRQREAEYGRLDKDLDFLRNISPLSKVSRIKTPLFVIAGKNDPRVNFTESEQIVAALKKRNVTVEYKLYDDEGHGISKLKNRLDLHPRVADFLDKYMK